ncbi:MAG: CPBP family intramembrane metalloprotease, partial [Clostridia bacterium]|nr:CPBP family intramembrane metalloprotease [Clostridia bacterium]
MSIYLLITGLAGLLASGLKVNPAQVLLLAGQCILVGFCEETLFRGIIQREFHDYFGEDSFKHVFLAILCAGIVFGLAHMINLDRGMQFMSVALQAEIN